MKVVDLTHILEKDMTIFPGGNPPVLVPSHSIEEDFYNETNFNITSHHGTHIDAPYHLLKEGKSLEQMNIDSFTGKGNIIDVSSFAYKEIPVEVIHENEIKIKKSDFILFYTGWDKYWKKEEYLKGFPVLSENAAQELANYNLKGVGFDAISVDPVESTTCPVHFILLKKEMIIIENLTNLQLLVNKSFIFSCFPLKYHQADGSPVRATAFTEE